MGCSKEVDKQGRCSSFVGICQCSACGAKPCARGSGSRVYRGWVDSLSDLCGFSSKGMVCCGSSGVRDVAKYKQKVSRSRSTGMAAVLWVDLQQRAENYGVVSILMGKIGGFTGRNRSRRWGWLVVWFHRRLVLALQTVNNQHLLDNHDPVCIHRRHNTRPSRRSHEEFGQSYILAFLRLDRSFHLVFH
jgi:hypothetical protein